MGAETQSAREYLEREVRERARHGTAEEVRTTCSFARAERLIGREYHGRFLMELLQNAADAWRNDPRSADGEGSRVAVLISDGPALVVANQGAPMSAEVVIESLGHIGASTKSVGEAIGHKGIGFKSVLEITVAPEIYSGLQGDVPALAVRFDPELAYSTINAASPGWPAFLAAVQGIDHHDELTAVPVLRYPHWVDEPRPVVTELAAQGFDTVVRLPFDARTPNRLGLDEEQWLAIVRDALADVSDHILLLLGCFSQVEVDDRLARRREVVTPSWECAAEDQGDGTTREVVRLLRNGELSSRWRLFRRALPDRGHLAGEIAVGMRVDDDPIQASVLSAVDTEPAAPFHLFFPTRIASGLPFLLHGYFEVDAARTGFYGGSASRNQAILRELAALTVSAVGDAAVRGDTDLVTMVDLIANAGEPEDELAREFREHVLSGLDDVDWLPTMAEGGGGHRGRPGGVFVCRPELTRLVATVFPPSYLRTRVGLGIPDVRLSDRALEMIRSRQPAERPDQWDTLAALCRPGTNRIWQGVEADRGFVNLLDLFAALGVEDRTATRALVDGLRGDADSRLLPTVGTDGRRVLLPVPDPGEGVPGRRSRLLMARARTAVGDALVPPDELDLAFLPEGLLASEADVDRAKPFGIRPFTVDNILDRLNGIEKANFDPEELFSFLWRLLHRERVSGFGTRRSAERAAVFDPNEWFWCRPGRAREDDNTRLRQQRERYLALVPVPCRDGEWRSAGQVAFGSDWADWLETGAAGNPESPAVIHRAAACRELEAISPGPAALIASPETLITLMPAGASVVSVEGQEVEEAIDDRRRNAERHAFLLRLGVWEVPPIEAFESRDPRNRERNFPWAGPVFDLQQAEIAAGGGWTFGLEGWSGERHNNVYLAEDYRLIWPLEELAQREPASLARALQFGSELYAQRLGALVFCPQCSDSGSSHSATRYSLAGIVYQSCLSLQLRHERWVACSLDGRELEGLLEPAAAWWHAKPPTGAGLRQSPYRLLPLCGPATGITDELRRLAQVNILDDASLPVLRSLLLEVRSGYEHLELPVDPLTQGSARQAFVSLHRLIYERLANLATEDASEVAAVLADTGVLCELGEGLVYRSTDEARHDDGRFATYVRRFVGDTPFITLPRDRELLAARLGIRPFVVELNRRGQDDGRDVTDELRTLLADRIPELLSIVVHHSLGTQTLETTSQQFEERARRLQALRVHQMDDLVIDASIPGSPHRVTIGEGSDQDLFLQGPTSSAPVLFHDLSGDGWEDRLRRKIAPHLAVILENSAYSATFALFLQLETDAEREEYLLELGISNEEVDVIASRLDVVDEDERRLHLRWYAAVLSCLGMEAPELDLDPTTLMFSLTEAGLPEETARRVVDAGGGECARSDTGEVSSLRLLSDAGIDLGVFDFHLRRLGDTGLSIATTRRALARWLDAHGRRCAAVLATRETGAIAKLAVRSLKVFSEQQLLLDAPLEQVLEPVAILLGDAGLPTSARLLSEDPVAALVQAGGFRGLKELDEAVDLLYDEEEQRRVLTERSAEWRRELRLLAVLSRTGAAETRATIRAIDETVRAVLPLNPTRPSDLLDVMPDLFIGHPDLAVKLADQVSDLLTSVVPDRPELMAIAADHNVAIERLTVVERALEAPRRDQAREIKRRTERLAESGLEPSVPSDFKPVPAKPPVPPSGAKKVAALKVGETQDRRKRELGDEGEQWALAAVIRRFLTADAEARDAAIGDVIELLGGVGTFEGFTGRPVAEVLSHAELARRSDLSDEDLIDELTGLLHVSRQSDMFGFDLIGWLPPTEGAEPKAMCLEVKSSSGEGFHLSTGEWHLAERLHETGEGDRYAVLVVRRSKRGGLPAGMDLLVDPVGLVESGQLRQDVDGYQIAYRT
jgi:hypothetical protein